MKHYALKDDCTMVSKSKAFRREETARLLEASLGPDWRSIAPQALDLEPSQFRRYFTPPRGRDDAPPVALLAVAELLHACPRASWPPRWEKAGA